MRFYMKRYICLIVCFALMTAYVPCSFAVDNDVISVTMTTLNTGNIFFGGEKGDFNFRFINSGYNDYNVTAAFSAEDSRGNVAWVKTEKLFLKNMSYIIRSISIDFGTELQRYDVYKMKVELTDDSVGLLCAETFDFSYVRNNDGNTKNKNFGINTHYTSYDKNPEVIRNTMPLIEKTGASIIRDSISWTQFESDTDEYAEITDFPFIAAARECGLELLLVLAYGNEKYTPNHMSIPETDIQRNAFAAYAEALASKLKGTANYFELWNEPNASGFNVDNADEADYAELAKAVYPALKNANENSVLMGMATTSSDTGWMQKVHDAGGTAYMDNISFHPYRWYGYPGDYEFIPRLEKVNKFLSDNNLNKKMWLTELGWSSGIYEGQTEAYASEYQKAMYLVHSYVMSRQFSNIEKFFWYNFICKGTEEESFKNNFGLVANTAADIPYAARPAYLAATNMNIMLADAEYKGLDEPQEGTYIYKFKRQSDDREIYVLWTVKGSDRVALNIDGNQVISYDLYGNGTTHKVYGGEFETEVTIEPVYIEVLSDEAADIVYNGDVVEIDGVAADREANCPVSIVVLNPGKGLSDAYAQQKDAVAFMDDTTTDSFGEYSFRFMLPDATAENYMVYIMFANSEGYITTPLTPGRDMESNISITINGKIADTASDFSGGGDMKLSYMLENRSVENRNARIIAAFYQDGILMSVISKDVKIYTGKTIMGEIQSVVQDSDYDRVSIYVWDVKTLKPYVDYLSF